jgi:DNA-binding Lrp family transcriptional regulator
VPRWLLLHVDERPSFRELAQTLDLSEAVVSRTMRALADDGLVAIETDPDDARRRRARLRDPGMLLDAYERAVAVHRTRRVAWDVGARDVPGALRWLREVAKSVGRPYAVGGLAGAAALVRPVVEPADVTLWIPRDDVERWAEALMATRARPGPGGITAQISADPFVLSLAAPREGLQVSDPVQLYLDCRIAGERALEAADAIRAEMGW